MRQLQENAAQLRTIYAGEKAEAIMVKEQEVMEAWKELLSSCGASRVQVTSVTDKVQFFSVVRENLMWMEGIMGQIGWDEPRWDICHLPAQLCTGYSSVLRWKQDSWQCVVQVYSDLVFHCSVKLKVVYSPCRQKFITMQCQIKLLCYLGLILTTSVIQFFIWCSCGL